MNRPPNLLLLLSDEQQAGALSCAGHPYVHTPNLDALAARGTRFANAYTPSPICVPARASLATGRWVHDIGCWDNAHGYSGQPHGWAHTLRDAGWLVEAIGKLHYRDAESDTGFGAQHQLLHLSGGVGQVWGSVRDPLPGTPRASHLFDELGPGESKYNRYDRANAERAAQWLHEAPRDRPWALFVGFVAPHFPLVVPPQYLQGIDVDQLPLPALHPRSGYRRHPWVQRHADFSDADAELGSDARRRLALACYFGLVNFVDALVGSVLAALQTSGEADHTLVLYSSDHGDNLGVRGMWNKSTLYREATQVPLLLAGPGVPAGSVCNTNVNLVDIAPTLLGAAGMDADPLLPGRSLIDIAREADDPGREAFSEYHAVGSPSAAYTLHHGCWAYHHYVGYAPELFDLRSDPLQQHDLAADAAHAPVLARMDARLRQRLDPMAVDARAKHDQAALVARFGGRERALGIGPAGASPVP